LNPRLRTTLLRQAGATSRSVYAARVTRILNLLNDDALSLAAKTDGASITASREIDIPCPDAALVWSDSRVSARIKQLAAAGLEVERVEMTRSTPYGDIMRTHLRIKL